MCSVSPTARDFKAHEQYNEQKRFRQTKLREVKLTSMLENFEKKVAKRSNLLDPVVPVDSPPRPN